MAANRPQRRVWWIWGAAVVVYLAAVFHRGSLGVAGTEAIARFGVGPAALSVFTVLQIGIYAGMQVPTGLLVDRFGSRRVLTAAAILLGLGQLLFAVATSYPLGLIARAVLGIGDSLTWVSVLRLVALHVPARRYTLVTTISSAVGAIGGVAATFPLATALHTLGWTPTFLLAGALTVSYAAVANSVVRDLPVRTRSTAESGGAPSVGQVLHGVREAWSRPGTRLALWVHVTTMFVPGALTLLWGYPYLINGLGIPAGTASGVLSVLIVGQVFGGPVVGAVIGRYPVCRMPLVLGYFAVSGSAWALLLGWPGGHPPLGIVVVAFTVFALGGPVSAVAFALVRDYNPIEQVGTATGLANSGGHSASAVAVLAAGIVLDSTSTMSPMASYQTAMLALVVMLLLGTFRTIVWWRRARAAVLAAQARGDAVPVSIRWRRGWDLPLRVPAGASTRG